MAKQTEKDSPRIGMVLSSGGVRGVYAHTGFLLALEEMDIRCMAVAGCSAGAVVGGIYASGTPVQQWAEALDGISPRRFWRPAWFKLLWSLLIRQGRGCSGFSSTAAAEAFCVEQLKVQTFAECRYPFSALAIDIASGEKTIFTEGALAPCMVASAAIPMLYQPAQVEGRYYSDGALLDLAPTDAICCQHKLDILIIHHVAQHKDDNNSLKRAMNEPWTMIELLNRLLYRQRPWYMTDQPVALRHCPCGCGAVIIILQPGLPPLEWPVTKGGNQIRKVARQQTQQHLAGLLDFLRAQGPPPAELFTDRKKE